MKLNGDGFRKRWGDEVASGGSPEAADTQGIHYIRPLTNHRPLVDGRKHLHHSAVRPRLEVCLALKWPHTKFSSPNNQEIVTALKISLKYAFRLRAYTQVRQQTVM